MNAYVETGLFAKRQQLMTTCELTVGVPSIKNVTCSFHAIALLLFFGLLVFVFAFCYSNLFMYRQERIHYIKVALRIAI